MSFARGDFLPRGQRYLAGFRLRGTVEALRGLMLMRGWRILHLSRDFAYGLINVSAQSGRAHRGTAATVVPVEALIRVMIGL